MFERVRSLWPWRRLFIHLVLRDLKARYKRSIIGPLWMLVHPLILMAVYTFVFSFVLDAGVDAYPFFLMAGLLPWLWFSNALVMASTSLRRDAPLLKKVAVPPELGPLRCVLVAGADFAVGFLLLLSVLFFRGGFPYARLFLLAPLMLVQCLALCALVLPLSIASLLCGDVEHMVSNAVRVLFFATPIAYSLNSVPCEFRFWIGLNPFSWLVASYRYALLGNGAAVALSSLAQAFLLTGVSLVFSWMLFSSRAWKVAELA